MRKHKLPRGLGWRGSSIVASFALADGTIERVSLGDAVTVEEAIVKRAELKASVRLGTYQKPSAKIPTPAVITVEDLKEPYLRAYRNKGGKDESRLLIAWEHLKPFFATVPVETLSTDLIEKYIESRRKGITGKAAIERRNGTVNRETNVLKAMLNRGAKITPPLVHRIPAFPDRLPESPARKGFIDNTQYALLAKNAKLLWLRALIAAAYSFGFRRGELLHLRVEQVDLFRRTIELWEGETKNDEARLIFMTDEVFQLMAACVSGKEPSDYVFTREEGRKKGQRVCDPRKQWYDLNVTCGLGKWLPSVRGNGKEFKAYRGLNLHDFRRSAIKNMDRNGVSQSVSMRISGHKTASTFRRYNIVDEVALKGATLKIEGGRAVPVVAETDTKLTHADFAESDIPRKSLM